MAYDRALELDADFAEALVDRALACLELDDPGQALRDLDRALALGRQPPAVLAARAEALARLGRHAEAERAFAEVIDANPDDPMLLVARGFSRLDTDPAGAEADFARALVLDPQNARAHLGRGLLLRRDDPRAALAEVEAALAVDPDFLDALQARALLRARLGDPAAEADVHRLLQAPTPQRLYNAACALSLLSRSAANPDSSLAPSTSSGTPSIPACPRNTSPTIRTSTPCGNLPNSRPYATSIMSPPVSAAGRCARRSGPPEAPTGAPRGPAAILLAGDSPGDSSLPPLA